MNIFKFKNVLKGRIYKLMISFNKKEERRIKQYD